MTTPPKKSSQREIHHINHLKAQREHLLALQEYLMWMSESTNSGTDVKYRELADLLVEAARQYESLVDMLQKHVDGE